VWFRGAEGCPSGDVFLARLREHAVEGRLAGVGDRIDFVVTLGQKDGESSATLERQSAEGTVALRELHGSSCGAVAEALALTLALAVDPDATAPDGSEARPSEATSAADLAPTPDAAGNAPTSASTETPSPSPPLATRKPTSALAHTATAPVGAGERPARWLLGLQGSVGSIAGGAPLWGGAAFAELHATRGLMPSARLSLAAGEAKAPIPNVTLSLVAGRLEGCPIFLGTTIAAGACAAFELGRLGASSSATGGRADASVWSTLWAIARLRYLPPGSGFSAEIQGGLNAPLTRYRIAGDVPVRTLVQVRPVGVGLAAGVGVVLP